MGPPRSASQAARLDGSDSHLGVPRSHSYPQLQKSSGSSSSSSGVGSMGSFGCSPKPRGVLKTSRQNLQDPHPFSVAPKAESPRRCCTPKRVTFAAVPRLPSNDALTVSDEELCRAIDMSDLRQLRSPTTPTATAAVPVPRARQASSSSGSSSSLGTSPGSPFLRTASLLTGMLKKAAVGALAVGGLEDDLVLADGDSGTVAGTAAALAELDSGVSGAPRDLDLVRPGHSSLLETVPGDEEEGWAVYLGNFGCSPDLAREWGW
ncbi:hypothetical protein N2152v2_003212 [Parachlorella kessleri]